MLCPLRGQWVTQSFFRAPEARIDSINGLNHGVSMPIREKAPVPTLAKGAVAIPFRMAFGDRSWLFRRIPTFATGPIGVRTRSPILSQGLGLIVVLGGERLTFNTRGASSRRYQLARGRITEEDVTEYGYSGVRAILGQAVLDSNFCLEQCLNYYIRSCHRAFNSLAAPPTTTPRV